MFLSKDVIQNTFFRPKWILFSLGSIYTYICMKKMVVYFGPKYTQVISSVFSIRLFYLIYGPFTTCVQGFFVICSAHCWVIGHYSDGIKKFFTTCVCML